MPSRFLSKAERARLSRFPTEVSDNDCIIYFTLTPADLYLIQQRRRDENHLGFALLLCSLRYLGHFPVNIHQSPKNVIKYVADQINLSSTSLKEYAERKETRWEHYPIILKHLGFRRCKASDKKALVAWLGARALEHDRPTLLLQQACERLYQLRLARPAITTMEDLVADARRWADQKTVEVLVHSLPKQVQRTLGTLLVNDESRGISPVTWLRRYATGHSDKDILEHWRN
jgi:TnpA family transposase